MTARWHLGPITGAELWRVLVFSPEILVFLFFMITDPKTRSRDDRRAPRLRRRDRPARRPPDRAADDRVRDQGRRARGAGPRVRRRGPSSRCCCPPIGSDRLVDRARVRLRAAGRAVVGALSPRGVVVAMGLVLVAGLAVAAEPGATPAPSGRGRRAAGGDRSCRRRASRRSSIGAPREEIVRAALARLGVPAGEVDRANVTLEPGEGQGPPIAVATLFAHPAAAASSARSSWRSRNGSFVVLRERDPSLRATPTDGAPPLPLNPTASSRPTCATSPSEVGLRFRHGLVPLLRELDRHRRDDGRRPLLAGLRRRRMARPVRRELLLGAGRRPVEGGGRPAAERALPQRGRHVRRRQPGLGGQPRASWERMRGRRLRPGRPHRPVRHVRTPTTPCCGTAGTGRSPRARGRPGSTTYGWHAGAAVGDVNGDGLPDLFVAGYTDLNAPIPDGRSRGSPRAIRACATSST